MGLLNNILKCLISESSSQQQQKIYEPQKRYTPEDFVIHEQEQSCERWHGVLLSDLSRLAQQTYRGKYVKVDKYDFLVFYYSSNSQKTSFSAQCTLDETGRLKRMPHGYYPGQVRDSADDFIERVNRQFVFE